MRRVIRNSKTIRRRAVRSYLCTLTRRQLRAAMTIPVMYEQLKREKLRLHKARYVLASWEESKTEELRDRLWSHLGTGILCCTRTGFLSLLYHNPVARTYIELHSMKIMKPKLFQLPLCCLRRSHWLRWSLNVYHLLLHAELEVGVNHLMRVVGSLELLTLGL